MAFSLPTDLATDWADNVGMIENAAFLNAVGAMNNANKAAINAMVNGAAVASVTTAETTASTSYTDLATTTDSVTVTLGNSGMALVFLQSQASVTTITYAYIGVALSGTNTVAASDTSCLQLVSYANNVQMQMGTALLLTGLTSGSTTFKMKYRVYTGTGTFANRRIAVIPFP